MKASILRPGYLVSLKSTISGGISYQRTDLGKNRLEKSEHSKWETTKTIDDAEEHEKAVKARGKAVNNIRGLCSVTSFGLICPVDLEEELDKATKESRGIADEFNDESDYSKISIYVLKGRIASEDEEAIAAIRSEVSGLISDMDEGINKVDAKRIREAANRAKQVANTLTDEQAETLNKAITEARVAARTFVKRIEKEGVAAEVVLSELQRNDLEKARAAFLDISDDEESQEVLFPTEQRAVEVQEDEYLPGDYLGGAPSAQPTVEL